MLTSFLFLGGVLSGGCLQLRFVIQGFGHAVIGFLIRACRI